MAGLIELLIAYLKDALFQPKDHFERVKKSASRFLLVPLITIVAGEGIFLTVVSALQTVEFHSAGFTFKLIAAASDSFIPLCLAILVAFALYVGSNYYYTLRVRKSTEEIAQLNRDLRRAQAVGRLKARYYKYLAANDIEKAYGVAGLLLRRFPDDVDSDPDFLESLVTARKGPQFDELRALLLDVPRIEADESMSRHDTQHHS